MTVKPIKTKVFNSLLLLEIILKNIPPSLQLPLSTSEQGLWLTWFHRSFFFLSIRILSEILFEKGSQTAQTTGLVDIFSFQYVLTDMTIYPILFTVTSKSESFPSK